MDLTRSQFGLIILFVGAVFMVVVVSMTVLNPEAVRGMAGGGDVGLSAPAIITGCLTLLVYLGVIVGIATLLSDARTYGQANFIATLVALILFVLSIGVPIAASVGGGSFSQTGDEAAYQRTLTFSMVGAILTAVALPLAAWFLFKRGWRVLPVIVAVVQAVASVGQIQVTRLNSSLAARTFGDQTVYLPDFSVPLDSGPLFNWQIVGWAGAVLMAGMWAMLLFNPGDTMVPRPEKELPTTPLDEEE
jgi:lysylphosphatidylglycerol synthetase-like protein (DUF2156 family)